MESGLEASDPCREERDAWRAGEGQTGPEKRGVLYASFKQEQGEGMRGGHSSTFYDEKELRLLFSRIDGLNWCKQDGGCKAG